MSHAMVSSVKHYLDRIEHLLNQVAREPEPKRLLDLRLSPDLFETGFQVALAIQFAARALCPPVGREVPEIPEAFTCDTLLRFHKEVAALIEPIVADDMRHEVVHTAGKARLRHAPDDYVLRFAFPNMLFHLSLAYAGLRNGGMALGKADFDGQHVY